VSLPRYGAVLLALWLAEPLQAGALSELRLISEHPIDNMAAGNLSGLAQCGDQWLAISDREDNRLQRLDIREPVWQATEEPFELPEPPDSHLPWGMRAQVVLSAPVRGGQMDFEGLACDAQNNRYLVSEAYAAVLKLTPEGQAEWLALPDNLLPQARSRGLMHKHNALYEGIAIDPEAQHLWLAAEREQRGLLALEKQPDGRWQCPPAGCVLFRDAQTSGPSASAEASPAQDFSGLLLFKGQLFTLERQARQICRRTLSTGEAERCWSFAATAQHEPYRYPTPYGVAEALWLDDQGAWVGLDNNDRPRQDGETRPIVWRFAAPAEGWIATP